MAYSTEPVYTAQQIPPTQTIVLGVDGSPTSRYATCWVANLAARIGARVVMISAASPLDDLVHDSLRIQQGNWRQARRRALHDKWSLPLQEMGVDYKTRLVEKAPGAALLTTAAAEQADLIVVGIHQHRSISGTLSSHLARHAHCPVIAVPAPATTPDRTPQVSSSDVVSDRYVSSSRTDSS